MSKDDDIVHLLLLCETQNDGEHLVSLLRNAGFATRAHHVAGADDLNSAVAEKSWDLFLTRPEANGVSADAALDVVRKSGRDVPVIILADDNESETVTTGLRNGARDVVPNGEEERLILVVRRELACHTERKRRALAEQSLDETDKRCQLLLHSSREAIAYVHEGMHIYANEAYQEMFGYEDPEELECTPLVDLVNEGLDTLKARLKKVGSGESSEEEFDCGGTRADDSNFKMRVFLSPARYDGEACIQILIRTVTVDEAALAEKLREISSHDQLTGLHNRPYFLEQLKSTVEASAKGGGNKSLFYISLDQFDTVRTEIGIAGSDKVLTDFATLLTKKSGKSDTVARFADDVFTLISSIEDGEAAQEWGESLRADIEGHLFEVDKRTVQLTASIGIAAIDKFCPSANDAVTRAHTACERVRGTDKKGNGVSFYDPAKEGAGGSVSAVEKLQRAIEGERFKIMFQPIINLRGEGGENYEATMRMLDEESEEELPPGQFLEIAAEAGLGDKVDRWATLNCIKTLAGHRAKGHSTTLFINLTHASLTDPKFAEWVGVAIKSAKLPAGSVVFQFKESEVASYLKQAKETIEVLQGFGCRVCVKNFGGSENSNNILKHIDFTYAKVDGSYTKALDTDEGKDRLKELVSGLREAEKTIIVPMVENANVISMLWQTGVNYIQGYYLQAPSTEMDFNFESEE